MKNSFNLSSQEFKNLEPLNRIHEFNGFDGTGDNQSPALRWSGAPGDTKSYAITLYDPDAATGSGFWHWVMYNISKRTETLPQGAGVFSDAPNGFGLHAYNDFGTQGYGGPCPPKGAGPHRYVFTVHALSVDTLGVPPETPNAVIRFLIHQNSIATAMLTGLYERK